MSRSACFFVRDLRAPFGGSRQSGVGREGGDWSFDFYCDVKNTVQAPTAWTQPAAAQPMPSQPMPSQHRPDHD